MASSQSFPDSYAALDLPTLQLFHHPASSTSVTPVIVIKLHRPEVRNAFTDTMCASLSEALNLISGDPRVRAVVITSSDPKNRMFCAGMDFNEEHLLGKDANDHRDSGGKVSLPMYHCAKPVIVALNGSAVGVGITMTLGANIRIASRDAMVGFVFARRGFSMEGCSSFFLPRLVGTSRALHLTTTGAVYPAGHKLLDGLFSEVVAPDEVLPTALKIADDIAANVSNVSTRVMKDMIYRSVGSPEEAHLLESKIFWHLFTGKDAKEGMQSFLEKRKPNFTGNMEDNAPTAWPWWSPVDVRKSKL
ncbi:hypothetical protein NCS57_00147100 [Fusarium keratoplasticum]|uniref:Uncharacterized protein n=1 Tax=Fusarium keratoplasticum TaxID=1328300 RepID=A0ACC0RH29_9HYPO|nr:hypothetical protein NCS57_00147100 [Fusarium keratoplasticum]KAI8684800.1 hypothetical protein NCS57_00147100 [Fusarium keratoplasticum]